jgi:hypothetical protein
MAVAYAEIDNRARADELLQSLAGTPVEVVGLSRLAVYLASIGNLTDAVGLSRRAARKAENFVHGTAQNVIVSVAEALATTSDVEAALTTARSAESNRTRQAALAEVASVLALSGDIEKAKMVIQELTEVQLVDRALVSLVQTATIKGDLPLAYDLLESIQTDEVRAIARATIVGRLGYARPELHAGLLREAVISARRSSDPARALALTAAAAFGPTSAQSARRLMAEALTYGAWLPLLPALSKVDPSILRELADSYLT